MDLLETLSKNHPKYIMKEARSQLAVFKASSCIYCHDNNVMVTAVTSLTIREDTIRRTHRMIFTAESGAKERLIVN